MAVERGRLVIAPFSGKQVPENWLAEHSLEIFRDISSVTATAIYQYQRYKVGKFGVRNFEGVLLDYADINTGETAQVFFNCDTTRARNTKSGKQGDPLPRGQFRVSKNHAFTKKWQALGVTLPRRLAEFHTCMGKLENVLVTGSLNKKGRIDKATLTPVNIDMSELKKVFGINEPIADMCWATSRQAPDTRLTKSSDNKIVQSQDWRGVRSNPSTDKLSAKLSNQVSTYKVIPLDGLSCVTNQTVDDWLNDYENA